MDRPQSIREAGASLGRKLLQGPLREHRTIRAFGGVLIALGLIALISSVSGANGYRSARPASPVRPVSQPLSSYQSGLVDVPNPVDSNQNQIVTGNVASGKHFRGAVPYGSPTSLKAPLGSTSLDSFMRYSTPSDTSDRISGRYDSFYSATGNATSMEPGRRSILVPGQSATTPDSMNRAAETMTNTPRLGIWSESQMSEESPLTLGDAALEAARRLKGLSSFEPPVDEQGVRSRERLTERQPSLSAEPPMTEEAYKQQVQELQDRLGQVMAEIADLERSLDSQDAERSEQTTTPADVTTTAIAQETQSHLDANISRRQELLQETARLLAATRETMRRDRLTPPATEDKPAGQTDAPARLRLYPEAAAASPETVTNSTAQSTSIDAIFQPVAKDKTTPAQLSDKAAVQQSRSSSPPPDQLLGPIAAQWESLEPTKSNAIPPLDATPAESPAVSPKTPARSTDTLVALSPAAKQKFESYLLAGQQYLDQGQFRRAADSFALAAAYKPNDARVHLGKSHALFAAGEYASSAFFLGKAVELDTQCVLQKHDLVKIAGGADAFLARFGELAQGVKTDGVPQLQFLLSYVYYQMDRPEQARAAIDEAWKRLSASASVNLFRTAITRP